MNITTEDKAKKRLELDEGKKLYPYKDTVGIWTIGIGHNLEAKGISSKVIKALEESGNKDIANAFINKEYSKIKSISEMICYMIFEDDISETKLLLDKQFYWFKDLDLARKWVLINMCFNLGIGGLLKFTVTLYHIQQGNYASAAIEMLNSKWAEQVKNRAKRLANVVKTGNW